MVWLVLCDFEVNQTKIRGGCQSGRKVVTHNSKSDLLLDAYIQGWLAGLQMPRRQKECAQYDE